jgi:hypothetical protein
LYVCASGRHTIRRNTLGSPQSTSTYYGSSDNSGSADGVYANARFNSPSTIAIDTLTNIYVADTGNDKIRKITVSTSLVSTIVGTSSAGYNGDNIKATTAQLNAPYGVDIDSLGNLYIADTGNNRIRFVNITTNIITTSILKLIF